MSSTTAWYLETRAQNLALMHLTRRDDLAKKLTNREIEKIISKVNAWYDGNEAVQATA